MNIVIGGAGSVGRHLAEVLAVAGNNVTIIDSDPATLQSLGDELDVGTLRANCAHGSALREAGVADADMFIAATNNDEVNLLSASVAKLLGAKRCVARIHHRAYFDSAALSYARHLKIDHLICPEYATAVAIARTLRNPGSLAVENFARDQIQMQELKVSDDAKALGVPLSDLNLPKGVRIATVTRAEQSFIPEASTAIAQGDIVTLVGGKANFEAARRLLQSEKIKKKHVVVMGGTSMGVWLCRALRQRHFAVRIYVFGRERAEELAGKLPHVTVVESDPTDPGVFAEERLADSDAFVALTPDDEHNILAAAQAKSLGAKLAIAVTARSTYIHLLTHVGIDRAFSPRVVAAREIQLLLEPGPVRVVASLVEATANVYEVQVGPSAPGTGESLETINLPGPCVIVAIQRKMEVLVPDAKTEVLAGDVLLVIGRRGMEKDLKKLFAGK
ncbi:MAG: Trk system potassium transporter TrkA [Phycisphaerae bacterium]